MRIAVIGAGYVGLVSGACLADWGHHVDLVDISDERITMLRRGDMPIYEPGLEIVIERCAQAERLRFTTDLSNAVTYADAVLIAVGTPQGDDGHADLSHVFAVARQIGQSITDDTIVIVKSTVPVGTGDIVETLVREIAPTTRLEVVSNPEFLREGAALDDFRSPDRVVVGLNSDVATHVMTDIYAPVKDRVLFTDRRTSELIKYAANAFLAMKVTFINEMADLCEHVGADVRQLAIGVGSDKRIGHAFLKPGPGYGGSCFPKDTMALVRSARDAHSPLSLIDATIAANDARKRSMTHRVIEACGGSVDGKVIAVLGLTFKANTDDMRDSPAIDLIDGLLCHGAYIRAYDPEGMVNASKLPKLSKIRYYTGIGSAINTAKCAVITTDWPMFKDIAQPFSDHASLMRDPVIVDLRNMIDPEQAKKAGFKHYGIGYSAAR